MKKFFEKLLSLKEYVRDEVNKTRDPFKSLKHYEQVLEEIFDRLDETIKSTEESK